MKREFIKLTVWWSQQILFGHKFFARHPALWIFAIATDAGNFFIKSFIICQFQEAKLGTCLIHQRFGVAVEFHINTCMKADKSFTCRIGEICFFILFYSLCTLRWRSISISTMPFITCPARNMPSGLSTNFTLTLNTILCVLFLVLALKNWL